MDAANILVAVLTSAAVGWLIWVEVHSRRNAAVQTARKPIESTGATANEDRPSPQGSRTPGKHKPRGRTA